VRYDPAKGRVVYEPVSIEPRTLVPRVIREDNRYETALKDAHERERRFMRRGAALLQPALTFEPHRTLGHPRANPEREQRRDDAHPEHHAPGEIGCVAEERVDELKSRSSEEITPVPAAEHQSRGEAAQPRRPVLEDERHAGRPLATHAEAEERAECEQHCVRRGEPTQECKQGEPQH
jgi:hypothetical protein